MATENVVITIRAQNTSSNVNNSSEIDAVKKGDVDNSSSDTGGMAAFKYFATKMGEAALNEAVAWAEYGFNREAMLTDDYIKQREVRIGRQMISKTISYASATLAGAAMGSAFGPVGTVVGAAIGLGTSIITTVRENVQAQDQQNIKLNQMNAQLDFTRNRAGWSLEAASIGEDL